jgi:hypothetical protein
MKLNLEDFIERYITQEAKRFVKEDFFQILAEDYYEPKVIRKILKELKKRSANSDGYIYIILYLFAELINTKRVTVEIWNEETNETEMPQKVYAEDSYMNVVFKDGLIKFRIKD